MQKQPQKEFYKKYVPKHFAIFTRKHLYWNLFIITLQAFLPATLLKKGFNAGVFL